MKTAQEINLHVAGCQCGTCQWVNGIIHDARQSAFKEAAEIKTNPPITDPFSSEYQRGGDRIRQAILDHAAKEGK